MSDVVFVVDNEENVVFAQELPAPLRSQEEILRLIEVGKKSAIPDQDVVFFKKIAFSPEAIADLKAKFDPVAYNLFINFRRGELEEEAKNAGITAQQLIDTRKAKLLGPNLN